MISDERQAHWLNIIVEGLSQKKLIHYENKAHVLRAGRVAFSRLMKEHDLIEQKVRQKIASLKRNVTENHSEWPALFSLYYEEELSRSHFGKRTAT